MRNEVANYGAYGSHKIPQEQEESWESARFEDTPLNDTHTLLDDQRTPPFNHKQYLQECKRSDFVLIVFGGSLFSLNAGFINVASSLISSVFVSHTTGNISVSAIYLATGQYSRFSCLAFMVSLMPILRSVSTVTTVLILSLLPLLPLLSLLSLLSLLYLVDKVPCFIGGSFTTTLLIDDGQNFHIGT
jgi:hypothetical protein